MKKNISIISAVLIMSCGAVLAQTNQPESSSADQKKQYLYEWTDASGTVHMADAVGKIPEKFRSNARRIESVRGAEPESGPVQGGNPSWYPPDNSEREKGQWQAKIRNWQSRLADAEARYRSLDRERNEQFRAWGSAAMAPIENRMRAEQIEQKMKNVQGEIEQARHMLNEVIPEEARKAGVPPGWLREIE